MSFFNFFKSPQISQGVDEYKSTPGALLLDVRTPEEYQEGHIPESKNLPLQSLANQAGSLIRQKSTPIFVYCHSGSRSSQAAALLKNMGYQNVKNIGGIISWHGKIEYAE